VTHWPSYNKSLVRRGEILFSYNFLDIWDDDLARMNENKKGKRYKFPDSFILVICHIRIYLHLPYRQTEGLIKSTLGKSIPEDKQPSPSYSQTCRRTNKLDIGINSSIDNNDVIIIVADSTGIKVTNRGQWMQDKWNLKNKKGYLKIHVAVDVKTKQILALEVTYEKVHDSKILKNLVEGVLNNNHNTKIKSFLGDGAYDSNENFKYLQKKRIQPIIKVKRNSIVSSRNSIIRNKEVELQIKDFHKWKKKRKYGSRWMSETAFSSIKRMFGEYVSATRFQNMVKEMTMKVSLYNIFRRIA
jgi:hypothetical protein